MISQDVDSFGGIPRYCRVIYQELQHHVAVRVCSLKLLPLGDRLSPLKHVPVGVEPDEGRGLYHFTRILGCSLMLWRPIRPAVATVHDLGPLVWAPERRALNTLGWALLRLSLEGLKHMDQLIADSKATGNALEHCLGIDPDRITVAHLGVDGATFRWRPNALNELQERYGIGMSEDSYRLLYVGSEAPRKNLTTLLEAMVLLRRSDLRAILIKVGAAGHPSYRTAFLRELSRMDPPLEVTMVGPVPDSALPLFYSAAHALVLPSWAEGFGLPALEAMSCGTPVLCSNAGALPEVVGDAAVLFDPASPGQLAAALRRVLQDDLLRYTLAEKGRQRASRFRWELTAARTVRAYAKACARPRENGLVSAR